MRDEEKKDPTDQPSDPAEPVDSAPSKQERDQGERMGVGIALGLCFGVVLALLMDNWAMLGVGIAMSAAFAVVP